MTTPAPAQRQPRVDLHHDDNNGRPIARSDDLALLLTRPAREPVCTFRVETPARYRARLLRERATVAATHCAAAAAGFAVALKLTGH